MNFKVLGKRILIEKPPVAETTVILTEEAKAIMEKDLIAKWNKLTIAAAGEECTLVKTGDEVYVGRVLEHAEVILIEEKFYFMLNEAQVSIVWNPINQKKTK